MFRWVDDCSSSLAMPLSSPFILSVMAESSSSGSNDERKHSSEGMERKKRRRRRRRHRKGKAKRNPAKRREGKKLNKQAIKKAQARDLQGALSLFQQALAADPGNSEYLNNLGVTYMRLKQYHKAESVLREAILTDPSNGDPVRNFDELKDYMPDELPTPPRRPQLHKRRKWTRIPLKDFNNLNNRTVQPYRDGKLPFVLTGAIDHWTRAFEHWSMQYFAKKFPNAFVEHYSRNMYRESVKPTFTPMQQAFEDMTAPNSTRYREKPGVYVQWNLDLETWNQLLDDVADGQDPNLPPFFTSDDLWLEDCMGGIKESAKRADQRRRQRRGEAGSEANSVVEVETSVNGLAMSVDSSAPAMREVDSNGFARDSLETGGDRSPASQFLMGSHWRMLLIGSEGAGMFNHRDILRSSSWQAQISGKKRWHVCDPSQDDHMYYAGEVDTFNPDYKTFPKAKDLDCIDDWVVPGELLFYPRDYWHHTEIKLDEGRNESISFTGTLTDSQNYGGMIDEFARECGLPGRDGSVSNRPRRIPLNPVVCERMSKCFDWWEEHWNLKNKLGNSVKDDLDIYAEDDLDWSDDEE